VLDVIVDLINKSETIAILPHVSADGDALGSSLALAIVLSGSGKKVKVLLEEEIPQVYSDLPGREFSCLYRKNDEQYNKKYDLALALDCGDAARLASRIELFNTATRNANLDHHTTNTEFAVNNYVDTSSAATGEIIYDLIVRMGAKPDKDVALCLYVAITTDTGGFRYSNTTADTHRIAAELVSEGIDVAKVSRRVFDRVSYGKVKLIGAAIDSLELFEEGKIALMSLSSELMKKLETKDEDSDGIINIARNISGVEVAALLKQLDSGEVKVNLRSNSYVDVSAIAASYSGGGHERAAGFTTTATLEQTKNELLADLVGEV